MFKTNSQSWTITQCATRLTELSQTGSNIAQHSLYPEQYEGMCDNGNACLFTWRVFLTCKCTRLHEATFLGSLNHPQTIVVWIRMLKWIKYTGCLQGFFKHIYLNKREREKFILIRYICVDRQNGNISTCLIKKQKMRRRKNGQPCI